jgi:hypothetical protein
MSKKILFSISLVLVATLVLSVFAVAAAEDEDLVAVTIINRTNGLVYVSLLPVENATTVYFLDVLAGERQHFTVPRGSYSHTTYACGKTSYGNLDLGHQVTLVFTPCGSDPANSGERGIEKIRLDTYPFRSDFQYSLD